MNLCFNQTKKLSFNSNGSFLFVFFFFACQKVERKKCQSQCYSHYIRRLWCSISTSPHLLGCVVLCMYQMCANFIILILTQCCCCCYCDCYHHCLFLYTHHRRRRRHLCIQIASTTHTRSSHRLQSIFGSSIFRSLNWNSVFNSFHISSPEKKNFIFDIIFSLLRIECVVAMLWFVLCALCAT